MRKAILASLSKTHDFVIVPLGISLLLYHINEFMSIFEPFVVTDLG